jgi:hypothetical protein
MYVPSRNASLVGAATLARIFRNVGKGSLLAPDRRLEARECDSRGSGPAGRLH